MTSLRPPPRAETPSRVVGRLIVLILLLLLAGAAIWAVVTNQRVDLTETISADQTDRTPFATAEGVTLNIDTSGSGPRPVVLLHDSDVSGSVIWDGVAAALGEDVSVLRIDLPGWGLSDRIPEEGSDHTVAVMAEMVAEAAGERFDTPVVIAGVGLGGEVAAEVAVTHPELVTGVVMVDVDFWREEGWVEFFERLPFFGRPVTFAFETAGPFAADRWAPHCDDGGWCPTREQGEARDLAETIIGTTDSIRAFRRTPPASLVPSRLNEIVAPTYYVWSQEGVVPRESVDLILESLPQMQVEVVQVWQAHLEEPDVVATAITSLSPQP